MSDWPVMWALDGERKKPTAPIRSSGAWSRASARDRAMPAARSAMPGRASTPSLMARFLSGRPITSPPRVFLGAAENPCAPPHELRVERLAKKVLAGADFVQTNCVFDVGLLERFMSRVRDTGLDQTVFILVGVGPLPSPKAARWLHTHVPGIHIPDALIERVERASRPQEEGKKICIELIQQIREVKGVAGVHLMAYRREHLVEEIVEESGLRRQRQARADSATPASATRR